ncbi:Monocarboxylate transporter [Wickerhamomyces ciferrii]|uniref:Monocarboxylate transporter n=1 Tax=Wickerhamomyces ciferrii (strain ATCC 14091 / BCRC 22168 / CBS 111 / JCM 3599 / NBRC 0793 / NRRL Y-1031 F-60-10) TaxID=1206466 RepID=K0KRX3_WICCF|nr:Monocarboxylate transporter [Wickerhamomyces ciferrii]CCH44079.1 Monocarboxylate transporter [Wickerhamomyces ciferrii]
MPQNLQVPESSNQKRPNIYTADSSATIVVQDQEYNKFEDAFNNDLDSRLQNLSKTGGKPDKINEFDETTNELTQDLQTAYNSDNEDEEPYKSFSNDSNTKVTESASDDDEILTFPEHSIKSYLVVMGSCLGLFPCFGLMNILGVLESYVNENQLSNVDSSTVGWIFSLCTFMTYTMCIFSGTYFDKSGARAPLILGSILFVCGTIATANCTKMYQFILAFSLLTSTGNGMLMAPLVAVISHYFYANRALMVSVATVGGSIGGTVLPLMFRGLFPKVGFEWAMRIFALISAVCLSISIAFARERKIFLPEKTEKEANASLLEKIGYFVQSFDFKALKDMKFFFCVAGAFFAEISVLSSITYFASYAKMRGFSVGESFILVTLVNAGTLPGRVITGYLADILGRYNVFIFTILLTAIINLAIWLPFGSSKTVLYVYSVAYGVVSGAVFSLLAVCVGQVCKTEDFGKRYSTMYFIVAFGVLVGVPIGGAIIGDKSVERYNYFILYTAACSVISAVCYVISRTLCVGKKIRIVF